MGCLSRIGCGVVLIGAGAVGYFLYGDRLPSVLSSAASRAAETVGSVPGAVADRATNPTRDSARRAARDSAERRIAWASVSTANKSRASSGTPNPLAGLSKRNGPAYVTVSAGDLATILAEVLPSQFPKSATNMQLALHDSQLLVRAAIDAGEIAGDGTLGRLLGTALSGRDSLRLAGTLEVLRPGVAQYRISALRIKGIDVPGRLIPTVLGVLRRGPRGDGEAEDAILLPVPKVVADLRITQGRLVLYKAVPAP